MPITILTAVLWVSTFATGQADPLEGTRRLLSRQIVGPATTMAEVEAYVAARLPQMPNLTDRPAWEKEAARLRAALLDRVVYRGEAKSWRNYKGKVEWLDSIPGGPGYRIKKLRYEALPGFWIPALLYEPDKLAGRVPVILNVNGHDGNGKAASYKQIRCINLAKRGMLALNPEWLGMGQLRSEGYHHGRMNQLDLCGTSGLAPFYLAMERGLDILLALPNADPGRVAVTGLSGGGWQTIYISALDPRVTLTNPVAGYSGFLTRLRHHKDLGDSEQTPCDMATVADYTHLTALMAPRATLLTYNSKDQCCFESGYALPPLLAAAGPVFKLLGQPESLRSHVNHDPGTHNYEIDNRQAFYRMLGDFFYKGEASFKPAEIPSEKEVRSAQDLHVELPAQNHSFTSLARSLARNLPKQQELPKDRAAALSWQRESRKRLASIVAAKDLGRIEVLQRSVLEAKEGEASSAVAYTLKLDQTWTVPLVELTRGKPSGTVIVLNDAGRKADPVTVERFLAAGKRVLAVDLFYFGECNMPSRAYLYALLIAAVGDRPLGIQASQLTALASWAGKHCPCPPATVAAVGPRLSTVALVAAGLSPESIGAVELHGALGSLKQILEQNRSVDQMAEQFCFGLLEEFDVKYLAALVAPRPLRLVSPDQRLRSELAGLGGWYQTMGVSFNPFQ